MTAQFTDWESVTACSWMFPPATAVSSPPALTWAACEIRSPPALKLTLPPAVMLVRSWLTPWLAKVMFEPARFRPVVLVSAARVRFPPAAKAAEPVRLSLSASSVRSPALAACRLLATLRPEAWLRVRLEAL